VIEGTYRCASAGFDVQPSASYKCGGDTRYARPSYEVPRILLVHCPYVQRCRQVPLTFDRLSTSSFRRTSNLAACCSACRWMAATSDWDIMLEASWALHPMGSVSNAFLSALLLLLDVPLFSPMSSFVRFRGRPRSMMLPDSDWPLRCPNETGGALRGSVSALGVALRSAALSLGVVASASAQGLIGRLDSTGAVTGVGRVEVVVADLGVVSCVEADWGVNGVKGVRVMGDSSVRVVRTAASLVPLPALRRLLDAWLVKRGAAELWGGMTKGARLFGESGWRPRGVSLWGIVAASIPGFSSGTVTGATHSARWWCPHVLPGALIERSWRAGLPGIVAALLLANKSLDDG